MSKILFTLAWYHDGDHQKLKPQLVLSCNPVTNLVMKGTDWKGARISNTNATLGARNRWEYSFTGGKSVTRVSLVMNTSAILPPMIWLSKHPAGPPTKTGPRGHPDDPQTYAARRKAEKEAAKKEALKELKRIEKKKGSPSPRERYLEDKPYDSDGEEEKKRRRRQRRLEDRRFDDEKSSGRLRSHSDPGQESRRAERRERKKREESSSSSGSDNYVKHHEHWHPGYRHPGYEERRKERTDYDPGYAPDPGF